jgi:hypothetical protein
MAQNKIPTSAVSMSCEKLLACAKAAKAALIDEINAGNRDWAKLQMLLDAYSDYQTGADALGYGGSIENHA